MLFRSLYPGLAPVLAPALIVAVLGCGEEAQSPSVPEAAPALAISAAAQALSFRQVSGGSARNACCGRRPDLSTSLARLPLRPGRFADYQALGHLAAPRFRRSVIPRT